MLPYPNAFSCIYSYHYSYAYDYDYDYDYDYIPLVNPAPHIRNVAFKPCPAVVLIPQNLLSQPNSLIKARTNIIPFHMDDMPSSSCH